MPTPDQYYGATMNSLDAQNLVKRQHDFIEFMYYVGGTGYGDFYLSCYAVHGPDRIRKYTSFDLGATTAQNNTPWTNIATSGTDAEPFVCAKLTMSLAQFLTLVPAGIVPLTTDVITIAPTGLIKAPHIHKFNYLSYQATTSSGTQGDDGGQDLNPSPPY